MYIQPGISDFQSFFVRDFPFGLTPDKVMNIDITNAMALATVNFNEGLWANQQTYQVGFLYLAAHYLVVALRNSSQGVAGKYDWLDQSKGVGSVNQALAIPERILENPFFSALTKTTYGGMYLEMIMPLMVGQAFTACARTNP